MPADIVVPPRVQYTVLPASLSDVGSTSGLDAIGHYDTAERDSATRRWAAVIAALASPFFIDLDCFEVYRSMPDRARVNFVLFFETWHGRVVNPRL